MHKSLDYSMLQHSLQTQRYLHGHMYLHSNLVLTGYDLARQGDENQFLSTNLLEYLHFQGTDPQYEI